MPVVDAIIFGSNIASLYLKILAFITYAGRSSNSVLQGDTEFVSSTETPL